MKKALFTLLLVLALAVPACAGGAPVEPYAYSPPNFFAATDGNVTVLFAKAEGAAGVRVLPATETSFHLLGPVQIEQGRVLVLRRKPERLTLSLQVGDPLPHWTSHLFTAQEAATLGVTFAPPNGAGAP